MDADGQHTFWASFTRAIRTPSRAEHDFYLSSYLGPGAGGVPLFARFNANPDFAPEQLNGYEVGYRSSVRGRISSSISRASGITTTICSARTWRVRRPRKAPCRFPSRVPPPAHTIITAQFRNDLYGFTTGGEIAPEWRPTSFWRLRGSYSFLNMNLSKAAGTALGGTPASVVGSSPRHEVSRAIFVRPFEEAAARSDLSLRERAAGGERPCLLDRRYPGSLAIQPLFRALLVGRNLLQPWHVEYAGDPGGPVAIRRSAYASLVFGTIEGRPASGDRRICPRGGRREQFDDSVRRQQFEREGTDGSVHAAQKRGLGTDSSVLGCNDV